MNTRWSGLKDIDKEFEEFARKNFNKLTEYQQEICKKLGITI